MAHAWLIINLINGITVGVATCEERAKEIAEKWWEEGPLIWDEYDDRILGRCEGDELGWDIKLKKVPFNEDISV